jgi:hypothetical protein
MRSQIFFSVKATFVPGDDAADGGAFAEDVGATVVKAGGCGDEGADVDCCGHDVSSCPKVE